MIPIFSLWLSLFVTSCFAQVTTLPSIPTDDDVLLTDRTGGVLRLAPSHYVEEYSAEAFCGGNNAKIKIKKNWSSTKETEIYLEVSSGAKTFKGSPGSKFFDLIGRSIAIELSSTCVDNDPTFLITPIIQNINSSLQRVEFGTITPHFDKAEYTIGSE